LREVQKEVGQHLTVLCRRRTFGIETLKERLALFGNRRRGAPRARGAREGGREKCSRVTRWAGWGDAKEKRKRSFSAITKGKWAVRSSEKPRERDGGGERFQRKREGRFLLARANELKKREEKKIPLSYLKGQSGFLSGEVFHKKHLFYPRDMEEAWEKEERSLSERGEEAAHISPFPREGSREKRKESLDIRPRRSSIYVHFAHPTRGTKRPRRRGGTGSSSRKKGRTPRPF